MDLTVRRLMGWVFGSVLILWALGIAGQNPLGGLALLAVGLLMTTEVRAELDDRFNVNFTRRQLVVIAVVGVFVATAVSGGGGTAQQDLASSEQGTSSQSSGVSQSEYRDLQNRYQQLQQEHQALQQEYEQVREENQRLRRQQQQAVYPPYVVAEDRQFRVAFVRRDGATDQYTVPSETLEAQVTQGTYMRELSVRQMRSLGLDSLANRFDGDSKFQQLEGYSRYYQYKPFVRSSQFRTISENIYDRHQTDEKRVRKVWRYTTQINVYSREIEETPRLPMETLLLGGGDCEDTAILAASLLDAMPADWTVQLVYMDADNPQNPQIIDHVLVYVDTGEYQTYIETTSNQQMTPYTQVEGFYVTV